MKDRGGFSRIKCGNQSRREHRERRALKVGDRVMYSKTWLRSVQCYAAEIAARAGTVKGIEGDLARVLWDGAADAKYVNRANLVLVNYLHLEPN